MLTFIRTCAMLTTAPALFLVLAPSAHAISFTTSYTDGGNWNSIYGQGFKASIAPNPDPGLAMTDTVRLDRFQFFKSGNADVATDFQLAILDNLFVDLDTLTTSSPELVGLSTNTISGTSTILTGAPITFDFNGLELVYGDGEDSVDNNYAAIFVTVGDGGSLTPILVPALIADYVETPPGSGTYVPESDYGDALANYFLSTTNFISGTAGSGRYFAAFDPYHADANFIASFNLDDAGLMGDFNKDLKVDAADYTVWRDGLGTDFFPDDYLIWKMHFGEMAAGAGAVASAGVPEPAAIGTVLVAMAFGALGRGLRRRR